VADTSPVEELRQEAYILVREVISDGESPEKLVSLEDLLEELEGEQPDDVAVPAVGS